MYERCSVLMKVALDGEEYRNDIKNGKHMEKDISCTVCGRNFDAGARVEVHRGGASRETYRRCSRESSRGRNEIEQVGREV